MPKLYFVFLPLLFFSTCLVCKAQILLGLKVGYNTSWATADTRNINYTNIENLNSIQIGVVYDQAFHSNFSLKTEFLFTEKGYGVRKYFDASSFDNKNIQNSSSWQLTMRYFEIPIMLKWFVENRRLKFYVNGGVYGAYWFSGTSKGSYFTPNLGDQYYERKKASESYEFDNDFGANNRKDNRFDYGLIVGSGLTYKIRKGEIFIEANYLHGFADRFIFEQTPKYYLPQMNRNWNVAVGFLFTLQPKKVKPPKEEIEENGPEAETEN